MLDGAARRIQRPSHDFTRPLLETQSCFLVVRLVRRFGNPQWGAGSGFRALYNSASLSEKFQFMMLTPQADQGFFPLFFALDSLPSAPLFFFFPCPSISKCPARAPSMASVFAVKPAVNFLFSLACLTSLVFLGVIVREPFFVIPEDDFAVKGFEDFLIRPCAMLRLDGGFQRSRFEPLVWSLRDAKKRYSGAGRGKNLCGDLAAAGDDSWQPSSHRWAQTALPSRDKPKNL